jgi:integrase
MIPERSTDGGRAVIYYFSCVEVLKRMNCPECGSSLLYHDGLRYLTDGNSVQRFLCRNCGHRFSEHKPNITFPPENMHSQIGTSLQAVKNLTTATETKTVAGEKRQTQHGLIVEFQWKMKKRQIADTTIESRSYWLTKLVEKGSDLLNPESVESVLATEDMTTSAKFNIVKAYKAFTKTSSLEWEPIKIHYRAKEPFYPLEEEIDLLINTCSKTTATFLQVVKDTGGRVSEISKIQWTDIDQVRSTIAINQPAKGSRTRTVKVTQKTLWMLNRLRKDHGNYVFNPSFVSSRKVFNVTRKRLAERTQNPRLLQIHFHSLRHWRASMEYERTGDIYAVKDLLGHVSIANTDRYQHGSYSSEEYITKRPTTSQEEDTLISAGFEYVRFDSKEDVPVYRKRK